MHPNATSRKRAAGQRAEDQMAFYLNRAFRESADLRIMNNLRLEDPAQPEHDGRPGVCQIDHLVLHRHGAFIIESKSVGDEITVKPDGHGGDEWTYRINGRHQGVASPIEQAKRQQEFLRALLHANRETLLGRMAAGLRMVSKMIKGTDQRGFTYMPIQLVVAVSDNGKINRQKGWKEPTKPFKTFLCKADHVPARISEELRSHASCIRNAMQKDATHVKDYGLWSMTSDELDAVADFLQARNTSPPAQTLAVPSPTLVDSDLPSPQPIHPTQHAPPTIPGAATCKSCRSSHLDARSGRYGYYWKCRDCGVNTAMSRVCSVCGADGKRGGGVSIRKQGAKYLRSCQACGVDECIWKQSAPQ